MHPRRRRTDLKVIPGEGRRDIYYKQTASYFLIIALIVGLLVQIGYQWLGGMLLTRRLQVVTALPGFLEDSCSLEGIILRSEQVICSPSSGLLLEMALPGERVAVGATIATIFNAPREEFTSYRNQPAEDLWMKITGFIRRWLEKEEGEEAQSPPAYVIPAGTDLWSDRIVEVTAQTAGLLSNQIDGWENPDSFPFLERAAYEKDCFAETLVTTGSYVEEGQPILKIVNNWVWYFCVLSPEEEELEDRQKVRLTFSFAPGETVEAFREEVCTDLGLGITGVTYRLEQQVEGFEQNRWTEALMAYQSYQGLLVPARALCGGSETGLFIDKAGIATFFPVEVIKIQDDRALVEGLPPYSRVISRPDLVKEGCRLN